MTKQVIQTSQTLSKDSISDSIHNIITKSKENINAYIFAYTNFNYCVRNINICSVLEKSTPNMIQNFFLDYCDALHNAKNNYVIFIDQIAKSLNKLSKNTLNKLKTSLEEVTKNDNKSHVLDELLKNINMNLEQKIQKHNNKEEAKKILEEIKKDIIAENEEIKEIKDYVVIEKKEINEEKIQDNSRSGWVDYLFGKSNQNAKPEQNQDKSKSSWFGIF